MSTARHLIKQKNGASRDTQRQENMGNKKRDTEQKFSL